MTAPNIPMTRQPDEHSLQRVRDWCDRALPQNGAVTARYQSSQGTDGYECGFDISGNTLFHVTPQGALVVHRGVDRTQFVRSTGDIQHAPWIDGGDCRFDGCFPALAVIDVLSRPQVIQSVSALPDGTLEVRVRFDTQARCANPFPSDQHPSNWVYLLEPGGGVPSITTDSTLSPGVPSTDVSFLHEAPLAIPRFTHSGLYELKHVAWHPAAPRDFASIERLKGRSGELYVEMARASQTTHTGSPSVENDNNNSSSYNPLAGWGSTLLLSGTVLVLLGGFVWWRTRR